MESSGAQVTINGERFTVGYSGKVLVAANDEKWAELTVGEFQPFPYPDSHWEGVEGAESAEGEGF